MKHKRLIIAAGVVFALVTAGAAVYLGRGAFHRNGGGLNLDLSQPDAYLHSQQLASLPRDLVAMPGLRDVLTQDFVLYYDEHPDRLSLDGTLKRLAFEHKLTWKDQLVSSLLNVPADVGLWRDGKGRLAYAAVLLQKNLGAQIMEQVAKVSLPDSQLTLAGDLSLDGSTVNVYALKLHAQTTWLFASYGDRLLVLTNPGMLLDNDSKINGSARGVVRSLLGGGSTVWRKDFQLPAQDVAATRHSMALKASYLSFGYQHFFPDVQALRLEAQGPRWRVSAAANSAVWSAWPVWAQRGWRALPRGAAFCAALPVRWQRFDDVLGELIADKSGALVADLEPGAALCWYPQSGLYAPVAAMQFKRGKGAAHDADFKLLLEKGLRTPAENTHAVVPHAMAKGAMSQSRDVASDYGYLKSQNESVNRVTVARWGDTLIASVDHRPVELAMAVAGKKYPASADEVSKTQTPLLMLNMPELADMLLTESLRLTPPQSAPTFNRVGREQLKPRLQALAKQGRVRWGVPTVLDTQSAVLLPADDAKNAPWVWKDLPMDSSQSK